MRTLMLCLLLAAPAWAAEPEQGHSLGRQIKNFELHDYRGATRSFSEWSAKKAVVIVFLGAECPIAKQAAPRLAELAERYATKDVAFIAINANQQDSLAEIGKFAHDHKIEFPILKDPTAEVADQFGATRTPEAFVLDAAGVVRYQGAIDDRLDVGVIRPRAMHEYLVSALDELLEGKAVTVASTTPVGCFISRPRKAPATGEVTYSKQVAAILNRNCVACHRPNQVAPFALTNYADAAAWGETIREVVENRRMPPWHANPEHGHFRNDARLSDGDRELIVAWVKGGCPQGDAAETPLPPVFDDAWQIPTPDVVYKAPKPSQVPATGVVPYRYFTIDPGFTEDKWIKAAEARPGNRAVTHHLILFYHPPGQENIDPREPLTNLVAGFAPGTPPSVFGEGGYRRIPAGSKLIIQAHYTPNGSPQEDQSEIGLVFADPAEVKHEIQLASVFEWRFRIPPGAKDHKVEASYRFEHEDSYLVALTPHMHWRGKSFRFQASYPDGSQEILLDVPRYDFNWQNTYVLAEPKRMPVGTTVRCVATYDNSADNPANPDPTVSVGWGEQTWEEMMVGSMAIGLVNQDLSHGPPRVTELGDGEYEVLFTYHPTEQVKKVYLAGTFNDWAPSKLSMEGPDKDGNFSLRQKLKTGAHEYKFVLDGKEWRTDPGNGARVGYFNNSLLRVGPAK